ncbi:hypothetical protein ARTHRO9AX_80029 [Arthrobacter sp. 9AX]|nr:hypothetical protein ARTHRO9AX_80029 [Arthrobacter sp. 9AX]
MCAYRPGLLSVPPDPGCVVRLQPAVLFQRKGTEDYEAGGHSAASRRRPFTVTQYRAQVYINDPGVVSFSPVSSQVFRPERIIGQPP